MNCKSLESLTVTTLQMHMQQLLKTLPMSA